MKKKLLIIFTVLALMSLIVPTAFAVEVVDSGSISGLENGTAYWTLTDDGTITISGDSVLSFHNWSNGAPWQNYSEQITKIVIEEGIEYIPEYSFSDLRNVTEISLPDSLDYIEDYAFDNCYALKEIKLPKGLKYIANDAFPWRSLISFYYQGSREDWENVQCDSSSVELRLVFSDGTLLSISGGNPEYNDICWTRDEYGVLTLTYSGTSLWDYNRGDAPWYASAHLIKKSLLVMECQMSPSMHLLTAPMQNTCTYLIKWLPLVLAH